MHKNPLTIKINKFEGNNINYLFVLINIHVLINKTFNNNNNRLFVRPLQSEVICPARVKERFILNAVRDSGFCLCVCGGWGEYMQYLLNCKTIQCSRIQL